VNQGGATGTRAQSSAVAPAKAGSTPPAERSINAAPAAYSSRDTLNTAVIATVGAVAVALAALLIVGWRMRWRRVAAVAAPAGQNPPPPPPVDPYAQTGEL
jgi:hypothetical protein